MNQKNKRVVHANMQHGNVWRRMAPVSFRSNRRNDLGHEYVIVVGYADDDRFGYFIATEDTSQHLPGTVGCVIYHIEGFVHKTTEDSYEIALQELDRLTQQ